MKRYSIPVTGSVQEGFEEGPSGLDGLSIKEACEESGLTGFVEVIFELVFGDVLTSSPLYAAGANWTLPVSRVSPFQFCNR